MKGASVLLLTIHFYVLQSIEREEPIEVDPATTHGGLENGHAATTGNHATTVLHLVRLFEVIVVLKGDSTEYTQKTVYQSMSITQPVKTVVKCLLWLW